MKVDSVKGMTAAATDVAKTDFAGAREKTTKRAMLEYQVRFPLQLRHLILSDLFDTLATR